MIEPLDYTLFESHNQILAKAPDNKQLMDKINEIVDFINNKFSDESDEEE